MNGLHKLKSSTMVASLFLQAMAIYLVIQMSGLPNRGFQSKSERTLCGENMAVYQWGTLTCLLLSITALIPAVLRRKDQNEGTVQKAVMFPDKTFHDPAMDGVYQHLKKGLHELESHLRGQSPDSVDQMTLQGMGDSVKALQEMNKNIYTCLSNSHDEIQKTSNRLNRIMEQSRECTSLSVHTRGDWRKAKPLDELAQMRQNLDNLLDLSKNLASLNHSTLRLIMESLQSDSILQDKIIRAQEHLERIHYSAHSGSKIHESVVSIISETRDNISGANQFLVPLCQKWDAMVQLTEQIDEIADQINAQSLAASMEMVRTSNGQTVTDLFPFGNELRGLAAQFHTFAHHIKDCILEVQSELHKTQQYLSQAASKSDHAFITINQCGEYLRNSVAAVKYSASELVLLQQEVNIHMTKVQGAFQMGSNTTEVMSNLDRLLLGHSAFSKKVLDDTSQISVHSEKISSLLTKQIHELNHCQKLLSKSGPLVSESMRFSTEIKQTLASVEMNLEKSQPKKKPEQYLAVEQKKGGEVEVTCWKISST